MRSNSGLPRRFMCVRVGFRVKNDTFMQQTLLREQTMRPRGRERFVIIRTLHVPSPATRFEASTIQLLTRETDDAHNTHTTLDTRPSSHTLIEMPATRVSKQDEPKQAFIYCKYTYKGHKERPKLKLSVDALTNITEHDRWLGQCVWVENVPAKYKGNVYNSVSRAYRDLFDLPVDGINAKKCFYTGKTNTLLVHENKGTIEAFEESETLNGGKGALVSTHKDSEDKLKRPPGRTPKGKRWDDELGWVDDANAHSGDRIVHTGVTCDKTGACPIVGNRYNLIGQNYDLCEAEYLKLPAVEQAKFRKIAKPLPRGASQTMSQDQDPLPVPKQPLADVVQYDDTEKKADMMEYDDTEKKAISLLVLKISAATHIGDKDMVNRLKRKLEDM